MNDYDQARGITPRIVCPVCGRLRGKFDFSHGKCIEKRAAEDGKKIHHYVCNDPAKPVTVEQHERAQSERKRKRYAKGHVPPFALK